MRKSPDFLIIGVQKGGTNSLWHYLQQHPQIVFPKKYDLHYFDDFYQNGFEWYKEQFPFIDDVNGKLAGEVTPYYIFHPLAIQRIKYHLPTVKLILLLRNPIDRAYSHFQMQIRHRNEVETDFEVAIAKEEQRIKGEAEKIMSQLGYNSFPYRALSYLSRGLYYHQLVRLYSEFDSKQVLILKSENLFCNAEAELKKIYAFLEIDCCLPQNLEPLNVGVYSEMSASTRAKLEEYYREDNHKIINLLGNEFAWNKKNK